MKPAGLVADTVHVFPALVAHGATAANPQPIVDLAGAQEHICGVS